MSERAFGESTARIPYADFRCGLAASFFAAASLAGFLPAIQAVGEALKFHSEEITELYLGLAIANKDDVVGNAMSLNPDITIFQARRDEGGKLEFDRAY